jgi:hypothetical protein
VERVPSKHGLGIGTCRGGEETEAGFVAAIASTENERWDAISTNLQAIINAGSVPAVDELLAVGGSMVSQKTFQFLPKCVVSALSRHFWRQNS